jgi:hypothetical protein
MRDPREECPFETVTTAVPGELAGVLWVNEDKIRATSTLTLGTTLALFLPGVPKGDALRRGYGAYVFTQDAGKQGGWHGFYFARVFSSTEENPETTTPFRTMTEVRGGIYWPPVLTNANVRNFQAYDGDGALYTADVIWDFQIRDSYDGPTRVVIEYFASHEPHTIAMPTSMQPEGGTFYYGVAQVSIPKCLHPLLELNYSTGANSTRFPLQSFTKLFPATNVGDWPATIIIDDGEVFDNGIYIRRKVTAYRPTAYASAPIITSPTTASIAATTVTLGGNVTNDGGATVTARGVVYSETATNADPVIGGTGVANDPAGTDGTGVFTVSVTSLTTATAYSYRAYATNARGTSYTDVDTFTTA